VLLGSKLFFVSGRSNLAGIEYRDLDNNSDITDLFYTSMQDSVRSGKSISLPGKINTKYYEGPFCFSSDGGTLYYTANDRKSTLLKIYSSSTKGQKWSGSNPLSFCVDSFSYCHPALSQTNDTMWFSSNMPGGFGKMDLYFSVFRNNVWSIPQNAGPMINSEYNEVFPFVSDNSLLYYASDRPGGIGGMDLYCSQPFSTVNVRHLDHPFNSAFDDFGIWLDSSLQRGYFSSNRNTRTNDDIYYFSTIIPDLDNALATSPPTSFCYKFYEDGAGLTNDTSAFEYEWNFGDGQKGSGALTRHCFQQPGIYEVRLKMITKSSAKVFRTNDPYKIVIDTPLCLSLTCIDTVNINHCMRAGFSASGFSGYKIEKAYWSFGDRLFNTGLYPAHVYRKPGEYTVRLMVMMRNEITGKIEKYKAEKKVTVLAYQD
jgi:hypothetical protein